MKKAIMKEKIELIKQEYEVDTAGLLVFDVMEKAIDEENYSLVLRCIEALHLRP